MVCRALRPKKRQGHSDPLNVGTETFVGAQATGIVDKLFVREGDRVTAGQQLAILKNDVAEAQVAQAQQAVRTA